MENNKNQTLAPNSIDTFYGVNGNMSVGLGENKKKKVVNYYYYGNCLVGLKKKKKNEGIVAWAWGFEKKEWEKQLCVSNHLRNIFRFIFITN